MGSKRGRREKMEIWGFTARDPSPADELPPSSRAPKGGSRGIEESDNSEGGRASESRTCRRGLATKREKNQRESAKSQGGDIQK